MCSFHAYTHLIWSPDRGEILQGYIYFLALVLKNLIIERLFKAYIFTLHLNQGCLMQKIKS